MEVEPGCSLQLVVFARPAYFYVKNVAVEVDSLRHDAHTHFHWVKVRRYKLPLYFACGLYRELRLCRRLRAKLLADLLAYGCVAVRCYECQWNPVPLVWSHYVDRLVGAALSLEHLSWQLSTLGGAFSSLGFSSQRFAHSALRTSWTQMRLAWSLGDHVLLARCWLYVALALLQLGRLAPARRIIRWQQRHAEVLQCDLLRKCAAGVHTLYRVALMKTTNGKLFPTTTTPLLNGV